MSRPPDSDRAPQAPPPPPGLVDRIEAALSRHAGIDDHRIAVLLEDGVITLQGTVASVDQRAAAEAAARKTPGVAAVRNELVVDGVIRAAF